MIDANRCNRKGCEGIALFTRPDPGGSPVRLRLCREHTIAHDHMMKQAVPLATKPAAPVTPSADAVRAALPGTLDELARRTGIGRSSVSRMLDVMRLNGAAEQVNGRWFVPGSQEVDVERNRKIVEALAAARGVKADVEGVPPGSRWKMYQRAEDDGVIEPVPGRTGLMRLTSKGVEQFGELWHAESLEAMLERLAGKSTQADAPLEVFGVPVVVAPEAEPDTIALVNAEGERLVAKVRPEPVRLPEDVYRDRVAAITEALRGGAATVSEIEAAVDLGRAAQRTLVKMLADGLVERVKGEDARVRWYLPGMVPSPVETPAESVPTIDGAPDAPDEVKSEPHCHEQFISVPSLPLATERQHEIRSGFLLARLTQSNGATTAALLRAFKSHFPHLTDSDCVQALGRMEREGLIWQLGGARYLTHRGREAARWVRDDGGSIFGGDDEAAQPATPVDTSQVEEAQPETAADYDATLGKILAEFATGGDVFVDVGRLVDAHRAVLQLRRDGWGERQRDMVAGLQQDLLAEAKEEIKQLKAKLAEQRDLSAGAEMMMRDLRASRDRLVEATLLPRWAHYGDLSLLVEGEQVVAAVRGRLDGFAWAVLSSGGESGLPGLAAIEHDLVQTPARFVVADRETALRLATELHQGRKGMRS